MNSRQRVQRLLRGDQVDRLPRGEVWLDDGFVRDLLGFRRRPVIDWLEQRAAVAALDLDLVTVDATTGSLGLSQDLDRSKLRQVAAWRESGLGVVLRVDGPLNRLVNAFGAEAAAARLDRRRTKPFGTFDMVAARLRSAIHRAASAEATALLMADDSPEVVRELFSPAALGRGYLPLVAECIHAARAFRLPVILHIAPWHWPLLDELVRLEPAALQGLAGRPLAEFREWVGPEMCLWGNAEPAWLGQPHTPDEVAEAARQLSAAGGTRYLFGTASGLRPDCRAEVVLALYDAMRRPAARA